MAAAVTMAEMVTRAKSLSHMEGGSAADFIIAAEWEQWINDGLRDLYDALVRARGEDYYSKSTTHALVVGTSLYNLPADHYKSLEIYLTDGTGACHPLDRLEPGEIGRMVALEASGGGQSIYEFKYRFDPAQIEFRPIPRSAGMVATHYYLPPFTTVLTAGSADGVNGWEQHAVITAAMCALRKASRLEEVAALEGPLARIDQRIAGLAPSRDARRPKHIVDARQDSSRMVRRRVLWGW